MSEVDDNRRLYRQSDRERLRRINYTRARRGSPPVSSLAEIRPRAFQDRG